MGEDAPEEEDPEDEPVKGEAAKAWAKKARDELMQSRGGRAPEPDVPDHGPAPTLLRAVEDLPDVEDPPDEDPRIRALIAENRRLLARCKDLEVEKRDLEVEKKDLEARLDRLRRALRRALDL